MTDCSLEIEVRHIFCPAFSILYTIYVNDQSNGMSTPSVHSRKQFKSLWPLRFHNESCGVDFIKVHVYMRSFEAENRKIVNVMVKEVNFDFFRTL